MNRSTISVRCHFAWWLMPCMGMLMLFALLTLQKPSDPLIKRCIKRLVDWGTRTEFVDSPEE